MPASRRLRRPSNGRSLMGEQLHTASLPMPCASAQKSRFFTSNLSRYLRYPYASSAASSNSMPSALPIRSTTKPSLALHRSETVPGRPIRPQRPAGLRRRPTRPGDVLPGGAAVGIGRSAHPPAPDQMQPPRPHLLQRGPELWPGLHLVDRSVQIHHLAHPVALGPSLQDLRHVQGEQDHPHVSTGGAAVRCQGRDRRRARRGVVLARSRIPPVVLLQPLRGAHSTSAQWPTPATVVMAVGRDDGRHACT